MPHQKFEKTSFQIVSLRINYLHKFNKFLSMLDYSPMNGVSFIKSSNLFLDKNLSLKSHSINSSLHAAVNSKNLEEVPRNT